MGDYNASNLRISWRCLHKNCEVTKKQGSTSESDSSAIGTSLHGDTLSRLDGGIDHKKSREKFVQSNINLFLIHNNGTTEQHINHGFN